MKINNYDRVAGWYDRLSRMVFFKSQVNAQVDQLSHIPEKSKILIVGGGTGWILEELAKITLEGLDITFVEISRNMLELAKKRKYGLNRVNFVHLPIEEFVSQEEFDVVHTAFLFDNFSKERIAQVFSKLDHLLKPGGLWLFSDFDSAAAQGKWWKKFMLNVMYLFFRIISDVEATQLVSTSSLFEEKHYLKVKEATYYKRFIKTTIYQKNGATFLK